MVVAGKHDVWLYGRQRNCMLVAMMYRRRRKCVLVATAVASLLLSLSAFTISFGVRTAHVGRATPQQVIFINAQSHNPETPAGDKDINDSDHVMPYRPEMAVGMAQSNRHELFLHNNTKLVPGYVRQPENKLIKMEDHSLYKRSKEELERFHAYFRNWPEKKPKASFYVLAYRVDQLPIMLQSVDKYFNDQFHYPVIIFHEADFEEFIPQVRSMTNSTLFFQLVKFTIPTFLTQPVREKRIRCHPSKIGYRHMCRFHSKLVYEEPTIRTLEYYWRLDDDSLLLSPISYDVFVYMRDNKLRYGYSLIGSDVDRCVTGLWEATESYIKTNNLQPTFFEHWPKAAIYYNNFEISSTEIWMSQACQDYLEYLDRLGGTYYFRWGDAPIHGLAISLFVQKNQTHLFSDIGYKHKLYIHNPENISVNVEN